MTRRYSTRRNNKLRPSRSGTKGRPTYRGKQYHPESIFAYIGRYADQEFFEPREPDEAVDEPAGSNAKVAAMARRVELGQACFHADDSPEVVPDPFAPEYTVMLPVISRIANTPRKRG